MKGTIRGTFLATATGTTLYTTNSQLYFNPVILRYMQYINQYLSGPNDSYDKLGPYVDLPPRPFVIAPCGRAEYEAKTQLKLLDAQHFTDLTQRASMFTIPLVSLNSKLP